jgi:hypothetical protein
MGEEAKPPFDVNKAYNDLVKQHQDAMKQIEVYKKFIELSVKLRVDIQKSGLYRYLTLKKYDKALQGLNHLLKANIQKANEARGK